MTRFDERHVVIYDWCDYVMEHNILTSILTINIPTLIDENNPLVWQKPLDTYLTNMFHHYCQHHLNGIYIHAIKPTPQCIVITFRICKSDDHPLISPQLKKQEVSISLS